MEASAAPRPAVRGPGSPRLLRVASDERLVALVRAGHEAAFEAVYDRHHRPILSFCRHMLGSREEAEDALQHTFLSAHGALTGSEQPVHLRAWLYTIARNRCLSMLRARREQVSLEDAEPAVEGLASEVQRRQDLRDLLGDLARLPDDQRAALVLAELGDVSHEDIAQIVSCPKDKVKALVFQARTSLSDTRRARDTSCQEIREQLATLTGGALRRKTLRRHLSECAGCREFRAEVQHQRRGLAIVLPVVPTVALKHAVLGGALAAAGGAGGGAAATAGAGGGRDRAARRRGGRRDGERAGRQGPRGRGRRGRGDGGRRRHATRRSGSHHRRAPVAAPAHARPAAASSTAAPAASDRGTRRWQRRRPVRPPPRPGPGAHAPARAPAGRAHRHRGPGARHDAGEQSEANPASPPAT